VGAVLVEALLSGLVLGKIINGPLNPQRILVPAFELREQLRALLS
jgi:hypothetical protein